MQTQRERSHQQSPWVRRVQGTDLSHDTQQRNLPEICRFAAHIWSSDNLKTATLTRVGIVGNEFMTSHQRISAFSNGKSIGEFRADLSSALEFRTVTHVNQSRRGRKRAKLNQPSYWKSIHHIKHCNPLTNFVKTADEHTDVVNQFRDGVKTQDVDLIQRVSQLGILLT